MMATDSVRDTGSKETSRTLYQHHGLQKLIVHVLAPQHELRKVSNPADDLFRWRFASAPNSALSQEAAALGSAGTS